MVSGAEIRGFGCLDSWFQVPMFVVSGTGRQKSIKAGSGLQGFVEAVTLLNTDSNLNNTGRGLNMDMSNGTSSRTVGKKIHRVRAEKGSGFALLTGIRF